jgi:hypothetical protein
MYELVLALLLVELACVGLLVAPLSAPTRRGIVRAVEGNALLAPLRMLCHPLPRKTSAPLMPCMPCSAHAATGTPAKYCAVALAAAWVYCLVEMVGAQGKLDAATSGSELRFESALYRAQRNTLLTGGATLLLLVVHRLFVLLKEVNQLTASKEALTKQAEGAAAAYAQLSAEKEAQPKTRAEPAPAAAPAADSAGKDESMEADGDDELARSRATIEALRERNASLLAARDAATADAEALKRQAKGLSDECTPPAARRQPPTPPAAPPLHTFAASARGACRGRRPAAGTEGEPRKQAGRL